MDSIGWSMKSIEERKRKKNEKSQIKRQKFQVTYSKGNRG